MRSWFDLVKDENTSAQIISYEKKDNNKKIASILLSSIAQSICCKQQALISIWKTFPNGLQTWIINVVLNKMHKNLLKLQIKK